MASGSTVIISGFADEGPVNKKAEEQLTMLAALGMSYYSLRFVDVGQGVKNVMQLTDVLEFGANLSQIRSNRTI